VAPNRPERQRRIDEILELEGEPALEVWVLLEAGYGVEFATDELGYSSDYFARLVATEFKKRLQNVSDYPTLAKTVGNLEEYCWKTTRKYLKQKLLKEIESLRLKTLAEQLRSRFADNSSLDEIAIELKLEPQEVRNLVILGFAEEGLTLSEICIKFGLTGERVRQILKEYGHNKREARRRIADKSEAESIQLSETAASWVQQHPGCDVDELANYLELSESEALDICPRGMRRLIRVNKPFRSSDSYSTYSREGILETLRQAFAIRNPMMSMYSTQESVPLTSPFYNKLRLSGAIDGPSVPRIFGIFGTWRQACDEAQVSSVAPVRNTYELRWTDIELIEQVAEFILNTESSVHPHFDEWCRLDDSRASSSTVLNQIDSSWRKVLMLTLNHLRTRWATDE